MAPPALRNRPELDFRQVYFYNAFQVCSGSRQAGMGGALPIPLSEILAYFEMRYIHDGDMRELLLERIQFLDGVYLNHVAEKAQKSKTK